MPSGYENRAATYNSKYQQNIYDFQNLLRVCPCAEEKGYIKSRHGTQSAPYI